MLLCLLAFLPRSAFADGESDAAIGDGVESWLQDVDWAGLERVLQTLPEETRALWDGVSLRALTEEIALSGAVDADAALHTDLLRSMGRRALAEACASRVCTIATLIGLLLLGALTGALAQDGKDGVHGAAALVCRCFTLTVVLSAFGTAAKAANACAEQLCQCMEVATPALMTLLVAVGGTASAGVLQPAMAALCGGVATSVRTVVIPLTLCAGVLMMFDHLSERIRLSEMSALLSSIVKWSIGVVTTLFTSVTALSGMTAAAFDGVSVRTAKYAAGSMFPMVGGLVNGSFDTVLGCASLVKNAAGLTAILLLASIAIGPILRIGITMLLFRLTAATMQPVAEKNQVAICRAGANMLSGLLAAIVAIAAMFIVTTGLAIAVGNAGLV